MSVVRNNRTCEIALSEFRHRNNINNLNYATLINEGSTLEFGGIKSQDAHRSLRIHQTYKLQITKKPRRSEVLNSFNVNEMAITHR